MSLFDTPPSLPRAQRQRVLDALQQIAVFRTAPGRTTLLAGLPVPLCNTIPRDATAYLDLAAIIDTAVAWRLLADGTPALLVVLENGLPPSRGSVAGQVLEVLTQELRQEAP